MRVLKSPKQSGLEQVHFYLINIGVRVHGESLCIFDACRACNSTCNLYVSFSFKFGLIPDSQNNIVMVEYPRGRLHSEQIILRAFYLALVLFMLSYYYMHVVVIIASRKRLCEYCNIVQRNTIPNTREILTV